jgi:NitT/TauT family transport system substrate-binding protein
LAKISSFVPSFEFMRIRLIIFIVFVFILTGCRNQSRNNGDKLPYKIATLKGPSSMGMIRLIDSISNAGVSTFQIDILSEPVLVRKMMLDGTADFAILPTTMAAILYNKGLEYQLIAIPVWGNLYLVGPDTTITGWKDIKNKRVYVMAKGMTPDVLFRHLLQKNGISPEKDIILDYSFPTHIELANAIAAGQAEPGILPEPLVSLVMHENKNIHLLFDLNLEWSKQLDIPVAMTAFLAKKSILKENPQLVEQLILSYKNSTQWVNQNPDSAANLIVKYNILPDYELAFHAIPLSNLNFVRANKIQVQINEYLNVFYDMNPDIIGGKIPDENFFY